MAGVGGGDQVIDVLAGADELWRPPGREEPGAVALASDGSGSGGGVAPIAGGFGSSPPGGMGVTAQGFGQEGYVLDTSDEGPMPKPQQPELNFAVGVPYFLPFATPYRDSWEIFREDPVTIRQLQAMRRMDGQARALFRLVTMPILAALHNASIVPVEGQEGGEEEAEFIRDMFFLPKSAGGMTHTFKQFVQRLLLAVFDGFSAFEMVYWSPERGKLKGKYTLRKIDWRPSETLTFLLDGQGEFNGFRQRTFFQGRTIDVKIPKERALYFACEEAERPFYGISLFESAFYHYDKKTKIYYIAHLAAQRAAVGTRIGTMPPNPQAADKNNFIQALRDLGLAQYIALPSADWTVTSLQEAEGRFDFLGLINHHNSQMSKSVLANWFDQDQGRSTGDSTLVDFGNQDDETFMMMEESIMYDMAAIIDQHIIPRFIDWNYGSQRYPRFKWGVLTEEQKAAVQDTFDKLAAAPMNGVTPEFMLALEQNMANKLGLAVDYDTIRKQKEKENALQRKVGEAQMQQALAIAKQPVQEPGAPGAPGAGGGAGTSAGTSAGQPPPGGAGGISGYAPAGGRRPAGPPPGGAPPPNAPQPPTAGRRISVSGVTSGKLGLTGADPYDLALIALVRDVLTDVTVGAARELQRSGTGWP